MLALRSRCWSIAAYSKSLPHRCMSDAPFTMPQSVHFPAQTTPMLPPNTFEGRVALVTGGGTGLGLGMTRMLAQGGAKVVITSRKEDVLLKTAESLNEEIKTESVFGVAADVRNAASVSACVDACEAKFGLPTLIVNNAAGNFVSPTERLSANAVATILDIVLKGSLNVSLETGKRLIKAKKGGTYLAITTIYAESGSGFVVPSACAKAGVETMTKSLCAEWGRHGLRFNAIAPGAIYTKGAFSRLDPTNQFFSELVKRSPSGRQGEVQELANLACYLLSDYSSWISGSIFKMDGGEFANIAGQMNALHAVKPEQWDMLEAMIRKVKGS